MNEPLDADDYGDPDAVWQTSSDPYDRARIAGEMPARFFRLVDRGMAEAATAMFTDTGTLNFEGTRSVTKDEIQPRLHAIEQDAGRRTRHIVANIIVDSYDEDSAIVSAQVTTYRKDEHAGRDMPRVDGPTAVSDLRAVLMMVNHRWRFADLGVTQIFAVGD